MSDGVLHKDVQKQFDLASSSLPPRRNLLVLAAISAHASACVKKLNNRHNLSLFALSPEGYNRNQSAGYPQKLYVCSTNFFTLPSHTLPK
jgi:hypothetical protein